MDHSTTFVALRRLGALAAPWLPALALALLLGGDAPNGLASLPAPLAGEGRGEGASLAAALLLLVAGGLLSGLLGGLLGIGGALVTIPVLHIALPALGIEVARVPATAVATALMAMVPMTLVAAWRQVGRGALEIDWMRRMALPIGCGAAFGAALAATLNGPVLAVMFAVQSCFYGARLLLDRRGADAHRGEEGGVCQRCVELPAWLAVPPMAAFCACVGMGGGSIFTPFLLRHRVPFRHAAATAGALNLCIALGGSAAFAVLGSGAGSVGACLPAAVLLAGGAVLAAPVGVALAHRVPSIVLQRLIGIVNVVSAATLTAQVALP